MTCNTQVFCDNDTSDPVSFQSDGSADLYCGNTGSPEHCCCFNTFLADLHTVYIDIADHAVCPDLNAKFLKGSGSLACKFRVERSKNAGSGFNDKNPCKFRINVSIKFRERIAAHFTD